MQFWKSTVVALLILSGCSGSDSADTNSTPKKTAMALAQALEQGDAGGIKAASVGGDPQTIDALAALMSAHRALADAATAKFGPAAKGFDNDTGSMSDFAKRLADAQVNISGDTAAITITGSADLKFKKVDGQWKADFSQMPGFGQSAESTAMAASMQKVAGVTRELAAEISAGKYPTIQAAGAARMQKIRTAIQNMPTTRG
jgi:hypothetical protein